TYDSHDCTGTISSKVADLVHLERIDLSNNMLHGSIPNLWNLSALKYLDLSGNMLVGGVPDYLGTMPSLQEMNLGYNFLEGPIPPTLGLLSGLQDLDLSSNRLTGKIPSQLGNISTLETLYIEDNLLNGTLPHKLGELSKLVEMSISGNNFTGKLPHTFVNLTKLEFLNLIGNNFEGPLPTGLFKITSLKYLLVTDMRVTKNSSFPQLSRLNELQSLILWNCSIVGNIPEYIGGMNLRNLVVTDMRVTKNSSFPQLSRLNELQSLILRNCLIVGNIPEYIGDMNLRDLRTMTGKSNAGDHNSTNFVTKEELAKELASWATKIESSNQKLMLNMQQEVKKLVDSVEVLMLQSAVKSPSPPTSNALASSFNPPPSSSLNTTTFPQPFVPAIAEALNNDDLSFNKLDGKIPRGLQNLRFLGLARNNFQGPIPDWVSSVQSKDTIMMNSLVQIPYTLIEKCPSMHSLLHIDCGGNGTFIDGIYYESDNANLPFYVSPNKNWAYSTSADFISLSSGDPNYTIKSRCGLSVIKAPLYATARISPITLDYYGLCLHNGNYNVTLYFAEISLSEQNDHSILENGETVLKDFSLKAEDGAVIKSFIANVRDNNLLSIHMYWTGKAASFFLLISILLYWKWGFMGRKKLLYEKLEGVELQEISVTVQHVLDATRNFSHEFVIGGGGSAIVYKANLPGGMYAVKKINPTTTRELGTYSNELSILKDLKNDNILELVWWYSGHGHHLQICKYMENKSLYNALFEARLELNWETRCKICRQIAKGLVYLHGLAENKIIHRDITTMNILLDENLNAKISDFGLARYYNDQVRTCLTTSYGTLGYMPPEYSRQGLVSEKTDVYSYGIVVLEIVSGKESVSNLSSEESRFLVDEAYILKKQGKLLHLIDRNYVKDSVEDEAYKLLRLAILCTNQTAQLRPTMFDVLNVLEGKPIEQISATQQSNLITDSMH
ncbi:Receptor-like protein kinase, partial [Thalictrum thalictroides]